MSSESITIINSDMTKEMKADAIECAKAWIAKCRTEKEMAIFIKRYFDHTYEPAWNCVVGKNFGSFVSHKPTKHIFFYIGEKGIMIFQTD